MAQNVASDQGLHCLLIRISITNKIEITKFPRHLNEKWTHSIESPLGIFGLSSEVLKTNMWWFLRKSGKMWYNSILRSWHIYLSRVPNQQNDCVPSEDSDQPDPRSLARTFAARSYKQ